MKPSVIIVGVILFAVIALGFKHVVDNPIGSDKPSIDWGIAKDHVIKVK